MSSDQQSHAQLNTSIDQSVCDHSFDSNSTECYTNINEAANAVNANEIFNDCHIEHSQYLRIESPDETEILKNVLSSDVNEVIENNPSLIIQSPKNIERSQHEEDTEFNLDKSENDNKVSEIVDSTEGFELPFVADAVLSTSRGTQEDFGILSDENDVRSDDVPCDSNAVTSVTIDIEQNLSNIDSQNGNATEPYERTTSDQTDTILDTNDRSIQPPIPQTSEDHHTQDDGFNEYISGTSDEKSTSKEREDENCDKISEIHETECPGQDDGHEVDKTADLSTDETEVLSNEPDFDDDRGEYGSIDVVDFDGTDEVENDEYILDTVVQKPRKERRRILMLANDEDSDAEMEVEREKLLKSPMMDENVINDASEVEEDVDIELLIQNEKPGPKSKKMSIQKLKELQVRALLRNAVVIPSNSKKKKNRIIDSDDDDGDNSLLPYCVDVDDIGLPDVSMENEELDAVEANSILMNDVGKEYEVPKQDDACAMSSYENQLYSTENKFKTESPTIITCQQSQNVDVSSEQSDHLKDGTTSFQQTTIVKQEPENAIMKMEDTSMRDSEDSTDSTNQQCLKKEELAGTNFTNFPSFSSSSSSDDEDEFIPNDVYFGTPDVSSRKSGRGKGRPRGRSAQSSSRGITIPQNGMQKSGRGRGTGCRARNRFIDNRPTSPASDSASTSSSIETDDEYQKSKAKRKSHTITIVKSPSQLYHNVSPPIRPIQQQQQIQRQRRKRDRFYDKSQDIPNAIYFGEVDVPLHVLHAYGGDSDSDNDRNKINARPKQADTKFDPLKANTIRFSSQVSRGQGRIVSKHSSLGQQNYETHNRHYTPSYSNNRKVRGGRPKMNSVSPSNDRSIQMMKKFFKAAGLKKVKLNKLWEGCKSNSERATKMLELLREKGLEGEPTISKCKQLKLEYLTKKEIEDLDPNLIIQTEGRTRRSVTRAATKRKYTYDEEEILETRTKLRNVIDSDSDFE